MTTSTKVDGRRHNGQGQKTELSESAQLVRCSRELHDAMIARAEKEGRTVSEVWRRAAAEYLGKRS